jgi:hypothetical protein
MYLFVSSCAGPCCPGLQVLTADGWHALMLETMVDEEQGCKPDDGTSTGVQSNCGSWLAMPYFISFVLLSNFVVLNLMLAIVLERFLSDWQRREELEELDKRRLPRHVSSEDVDEFCELWSEYDPSACGKVPREALPRLIVRLRRPLGLASDDAATTRAALRLIARAAPNGKERAQELLETSAMAAYAVDVEEGAFGPALKTPAELVAEQVASEAAAKMAAAAFELCRGLKGRLIGDGATPKHVGFRQVLSAMIQHSFAEVCDVPSPNRLLQKAFAVASQRSMDEEGPEGYVETAKTLQADLQEFEPRRASGAPHTQEFLDVMGAMHEHVTRRPTSWSAALKAATIDAYQARHQARMSSTMRDNILIRPPDNPAEEQPTIPTQQPTIPTQQPNFRTQPPDFPTQPPNFRTQPPNFPTQLPSMTVEHTSSRTQLPSAPPPHQADLETAVLTSTAAGPCGFGAACAASSPTSLPTCLRQCQCHFMHSGEQWTAELVIRRAVADVFVADHGSPTRMTQPGGLGKKPLRETSPRSYTPEVASQRPASQRPSPQRLAATKMPQSAQKKQSTLALAYPGVSPGGHHDSVIGTERRSVISGMQL